MSPQWVCDGAGHVRNPPSLPATPSSLLAGGGAGWLHNSGRLRRCPQLGGQQQGAWCRQLHDQLRS